MEAFTYFLEIIANQLPTLGGFVQQRVYKTFRNWYNQQIYGHYGRTYHCL